MIAGIVIQRHGQTGRQIQGVVHEGKIKAFGFLAMRFSGGQELQELQEWQELQELQEYRSTGVQEYRSTGVMEYWRDGYWRVEGWSRLD